MDRARWAIVWVVTGMALWCPALAMAGLEGRLLVDGVEGATMDPKEPSRWTLGFQSPDGAPVSFELEHQKYMHLIVVSEDLSSFAHIHPALQPGTGTFLADVNTPTSDPDNQDLARVVTRPGRHFLFAEVHPEGGDLEQHRFTVRASGTSEAAPLVPEVVGGDGWVTHFLDSEGQLSSEGAEYRIRLRPEAIKAEMVHLTFRVERRAGNEYAPVEDLQPWLGMDAHAVMVGGNGATAGERVFRHLHAGHHDDHGKSSGAHILFMLHGDDVPPSGVYRVWLQVKRQGRVLTFPFTCAL